MVDSCPYCFDAGVLRWICHTAIEGWRRFFRFWSADGSVYDEDLDRFVERWLRTREENRTPEEMYENEDRYLEPDNWEDEDEIESIVPRNSNRTTRIRM